MRVEIKESPDYNKEQILQLYSSVDWTNYTDNQSMLFSAIDNSLKVLFAFDGDRLVWLIRAVGDDHSILYVQDILVLPEYQRNGIGKSLLLAVDALYPDVYQKVLLTDRQPSSVKFYQSCGFTLSDDLQCAAFVKFTT